MNCFNCEMDRTCESCLDLISQKRTYSSDINMLKRKPQNEYYRMLPRYEGEYKPNQIFTDFESAREILMEEEYYKVVKRRFERTYNLMECISYMKTEDIPEKKRFILWIQTY